MKFPKQAALEGDEMHRVDRARLAMLLHKLPHEIDTAPLVDILDLCEVKRIDAAIAEMDAAKAKAKARGRRRR